ncbi:hypothetical protein L6452_26551 [Arctium lappa]|uniref:Uncharacterized protein n=1 Tax=Arctium lappa TaxID=4217 RepID=A0ACB8ZU00_ARCLA|nr:hypothetical protein L6452_26551 [Arctium lappa]
MENRFKLQISKILQSTFNSCRPKNNSDVSDHRLFFLKTPHHRRLIDLFSPKPPPPPLTSSSSSSQPPKPHHLSRLGPTRFPAYTDRRRIPQSVSPPFHEKPTNRGRKKKPHHRKRRNNPSSNFSSTTDNYYYNWWSSDDDNQSDGKTTLFSRRSLSSDSFESVRKNRARRTRGGSWGGGGDRESAGAGAMDGFAVAKESSDPHEDFRSSMVDMIVEKGIFGVEELENLVECFVSLNTEEHHKVIFEVFAEIWETLILDLAKKDGGARENGRENPDSVLQDSNR